MNRIILLLCSFLLINTLTLAQEKFLKVVQITDLVYQVQFVDQIWVNCLVVKDGEKCILVDSGLNSLADSLKSEMTRLGCKNVSYILNTHAHWDHFSGNVTFGKKAKIIAHQSTVNDLKMYGLPKHILPTVLVGSEKKMMLGKTPVEIYHMPKSHSKGDIIAYFPERKVLATGDLFFPLSFPLITTSQGMSIEQYQKNLSWIENHFPDSVIIVPGHGEVMKKTDLIGYILMVNETIREVRGEIEKGLTFEQIMEGEPLKKWRLYKRNYSPDCNHKEMWIKAIYDTYGYAK